MGKGAAMHVADRGQCVIGLCKVKDIEGEYTEMPRLPWMLFGDIHSKRDFSLVSAIWS
jgi:hypothetical protein